MSSKSWRLAARDGYSALYSGINNLRKTNVVTHIGLLGTVFDHDGTPLDQDILTNALKNELRQLLLQQGCVPVFVDSKVAHGHYEGYCKTVLQPLLHYIVWDTDYTGEDQNNHQYYLTVNEAVADSVQQSYRDGDLSEEQLIIADMPVALIILERQEFLEGVLGADLIGFQVYAYARHFLSCATRLLGLEASPKGVEFRGRPVNAGIFPIGVDVETSESRRDSPEVRQRIEALREVYRGQKVIVGRDKLNQINGIQHKLNAFEKFLETHNEFHNKVVLVQVAAPPEQEVHRFETKLNETSSRINSRYGSLEYTPVHLIQQNLDPDEYYALLSIADAGLITSVRDGMNTTSHEYVICQKGDLSYNHGPLILSEFTGTAGSMGSAIMVNPWDSNGVANAINEALTMNQSDKLSKHKQLYNSVRLQSSANWAQSFISELQGNAKLGSGAGTNTPLLDRTRILDAFQKSSHRLLVFDYDGTLTPIVRFPQDAVPPPKMIAALSKLASDPRNYCFVVSGRDQATLENWLGSINGLGLSAEHGGFIKYPESDDWIDLLEGMDLSWKDEVIKIFNYYTERTQGSSIELKKSSVTWHYRNADPEWGAFQAKECQDHLEGSLLSKRPIEVLVGKKNLEVRP
ncbi:threalose-6-phosphate phosphatase, partial [Gonapodya sp. JEL0774]